MDTSDLEVIWPLHRSHYLSPALAEAGIDMETEPEPESFDMPAAPVVRPVATGRDLATRALQAGADCSQQRVSELLGVSRRTLSRTVDPDFVAALHDPAVVEEARTRLSDSASRGSTAEEREAAGAWLGAAVRDEQHVARSHQRTSIRRPTPQAHAATTVKRTGAGSPGKRPAVSTAVLGATLPGPPPAVFAPDQIDALTRQQRRIVHRGAILAYVIAAETRSGQPLTLGDAVVELLADITEAARMIGTILGQASLGAVEAVGTVE